MCDYKRMSKINCMDRVINKKSIGKNIRRKAVYGIVQLEDVMNGQAE